MYSIGLHGLKLEVNKRKNRYTRKLNTTLLSNRQVNSEIKKEIESTLELNENDNIIYPNP